MRLRCTFLLLLLLAAASVVAQQSVVGEKGFQPDKMYDFSAIDHVNTFGGNLVVTIPIGMRYPLDGGLTYGLALVHNSKVWDLDNFDAFVKSWPSRRSNAGIGWLLTMGRLVPPADPTNSSMFWVYETPDGADHTFFPAPLYPDAPCTGARCSATQYTHDGSFLRMEELSSTLRRIDSPNGVSHEFELSGSTWRLKRMFNAFKDAANNPRNYVNVTYPAPATVSQCPGASLVWQLSDSKTRVQFVCFKDQYVAGDYVPMADRAVLTAFGGTSATYLFEYDVNQTIQKSCEDTTPADGRFPVSFQVPVLRRVKLPDGNSQLCTTDDCSRYEITSFSTGCDTGAVAQITLPTLGSVAYTYGVKEVQPRDPCALRATGSVGLTTRTLKDALGTVVGAWTYASALVVKSGPGYTSAGNCQQDPVKAPRYPVIRDEMTTTVTDPSGDKVVHHFSVWPGNPGSPYGDAVSPDGFLAQEYSLPIGKYDFDAQVNLSREILDCDAAGANCTTARKEYVRYRLDPGDGDADLPGTFKILDAERTVYLDDLVQGVPRYAHVESSDEDGFGHHRTSSTSGNFDAGNVRTKYTNFNPGADYHGRVGQNSTFRFSTEDAWILGTYDETTVTEGTLSLTTKACFDPSNGFLRATRVGGTTPANDLLTLFVPEKVGTVATGNVASEQFYGGDLQPLNGTAASGVLCDIAETTNPGVLGYRIDHTYAYGVRATSKYNGQSFYTLDQDIDPAGLVSTARGTDSLATVFTFDCAGRITSLQPPGVAATSYTYARANVSNGAFTPSTVTATTVSSTVNGGKLERQYHFDALGRYWREKMLLRDSTYGVREILYDSLGRKVSASEMEAVTIPTGRTEWDVHPVHTTTYTGFDAFGRPGTETAPGGTTTFTYTGVRKVARTASVATGGTFESLVTTIETYDRQGRLLSVTEAADTPMEAVTTYTYDAADHLTGVAMTREGQPQSRTFTYDRRGVLTAEQHPELGTSGYGQISYSNIDARGHAHRRMTAAASAFDLTFDYDAAERVTAVKATAGSVLLKQFAYGSNGKLSSATRYNAGDLGTIAVTETLQYDSATGRPSRRDIAVGSTATFLGADFFHSQAYNDIGTAASVTNPCRASAGLCASDDAPALTVPYSYRNGFLIAVGSWCSDITYQPDGAVDTVTHGNGISAVKEVWTPDPSGLPRPKRISAVATSGAELWSTGDYAFDGSGHIMQVGGSKYAYDLLGRLTQWTVLPAEGGFASTFFGYDGFGNRTQETYNGCGPGGVRCYTSTVLPRDIAGVSNHYTSMTYDAAGDVTNDGRRVFGYDAFSMLTRASVGGREFRYLYTANDERVAAVELPQQVISGAVPRNRTTWTLRGFNNLLQAVWTDDGTSGTRIWTLKERQIWRGGSLLATDAPATGTRHYFLDHLGSPRFLTTGSGTPLAVQAFGPFGAGGLVNSSAVQFTGHERDAATLAGGTADLPDYMHARYYDVATGRFLSVDPSRAFDVHHPLSFNRYAYAWNNPLQRIDPDGKDSFPIGPAAQAIVDNGLNFSATFREQYTRLSGDSRVLWFIHTDLQAAPGTRAHSNQQIVRDANGNITRIVVNTYIPMRVGTNEQTARLGHEGAHNTQTLDTGFTAKELAERHDPGAWANTSAGSNHYETRFALDTERTIRQELSQGVQLIPMGASINTLLVPTQTLHDLPDPPGVH